MTIRFLVERIESERVIDHSDFSGIDFLELALAVSRPVGRVHIRNNPNNTAGVGIGFMVSTRAKRQLTVPFSMRYQSARSFQ